MNTILRSTYHYDTDTLIYQDMALHYYILYRYPLLTRYSYLHDIVIPL